ncbi:MAG TPA: hypothetical protein VGH89_29010 [Pseudonocardia sp.]|jgi:hypothetical protein
MTAEHLFEPRIIQPPEELTRLADTHGRCLDCTGALDVFVAYPDGTPVAHLWCTQCGRHWKRV